MPTDTLILIVFMVVFGLIMWWQSKKAKQQRDQLQDFRNSLAPGTEVITIGGVIGKVVSVDTKYEEIVIDSEGSQLRFKFSAVNKTYTRPAFIDDSEVDQDGNPLPSGKDATTDDTAAQESVDTPDSKATTTDTTSDETETTSDR